MREVDPKSAALDLAEVAAAILDDPAVDECVVLARTMQNSGPESVAYVVASGPFSPRQLEARLRAALPATQLPSAYVPVSALPLTPEGQVDESALNRLEVIDADLIQRWEEQLRSLPEIEQVAVVIREHTESFPPLHLSDLLPGWEDASARPVGEPVQVPNHTTVAQQASEPKVPAITHGGALRTEAGAPTVLAEALERAAMQSSDKGIVYIENDGSESFQSYPAMLEEAQRVLAGLRGLGLKPQDKVIFQFERNRDFVLAFWGCTLGGFIPVPLSIASTYRELNAVVTKLHNSWQMLKRPVVLTGKALAPAVRSLSNLLNLDEFRVETIDDLLASEPDRHRHDSQPDDLALLLLTSGSTGFPKGVMQTHRSLLSQSAGTAQLNKFSHEDVSLNWLPLDHVGGIVMFHLRDVYLGCQQIHAPTQSVLQNPLKWLDWIDNYQATITWAPNFAFGLINDQAEKINRSHWNLSSMRFILNGGEAIVAKTAREFLEVLHSQGLSPEAMHPAWGMSETCSGVTYSDTFSLGSTRADDPFVEVGAPIPGFSMRIVDSQNQVIEEDNIGRLQVKGLPVTTGYYNNPGLNREVFTDDDWFDTGDLGFLHNGRLTITGRETDVIIINGINYYSQDIEAVVEEIEGVETSFTAACAVRDSGTDTDQLAIFFHSPSFGGVRLLELLHEVRSRVVNRLGINAAHLIPVEKEDIPKTAIGKIQRAQLIERFAACEFDAILKRIDILSGNSNTIPDWFYRKVWHPKEAVNLTPKLGTGPYLVFLDGLGLGASLCAHLGQIDRLCVGVEAGAEFTKLAPNNYRINPNDPEQYLRLLRALADDGIRVDQLLHLWTYSEFTGEVPSLKALEQAQHQGVYSVLFLAQALAQVQSPDHPVQLHVITSQAQATAATDLVAYEKSTLTGLLKTIPLELSWLRCRHIDLEVDRVEVTTELVLSELGVLEGEPEVAYRDGQRQVSSLAKVDLLQQEKQDIPFKRGDVFLVTGGLGGIGAYFAQFLIKEYQAKLVIVGRTPLPDRAEWSAQLEQGTLVSKRINSYLAIEATGGEFVYEVVDVCDLAGLKKVVAQAESKWEKPLSGIIHLAGEGNLEQHWRTAEEHWVTVETRETFDWMFRPKVYGTWTLSQLIKDKPQAVLINFSSVNGLFGGATFSAYSAANSFLDVYSIYQRRHAHPQTYCFSWSLWDDLGMSEGNPTSAKDAAQNLGYFVIAKEKGIQSLIAGLYHNQGHLIVGLDGSNRKIRRYSEVGGLPTEKLTAYFTASTDDLPIAKLQEFKVRDRFGTPSTCDFLPVSEMPLTEEGEMDRQQLASVRNGTSQMTAAQAQPQTELERQLADLWKEIFGVQSVGVHDNFFDLGGHSLLMVRLHGKLLEVVKRQVSIIDLFQYPTISSLAKYLSDSSPEQGEPLAIQPFQERAQKRREALSRRRPQIPGE